MLRQQVSDGAIRHTSLSQFGDNILRREQIMEFLWTTWRKFFDRLVTPTNCVGCSPVIQ